jgi:hypothetical protein
MLTSPSGPSGLKICWQPWFHFELLKPTIIPLNAVLRRGMPCFSRKFLIELPTLNTLPFLMVSFMAGNGSVEGGLFAKKRNYPDIVSSNISIR